ncbi:sulfotransferase [Streptomyces griseoincarnatus]
MTVPDTRAHDTAVLDPDRITELTGGPAGDARADEALRRLTAALDREARLTPAGRAVTAESLVAALRTRRQAEALAAADPGLRESPPRAPLFVTGPLRSGTTLLHSLLATLPGTRAPKLWELMAPADPAPDAQLVERARRYVNEYYRAAPAFRAIHPLAADEPEECHRLTGTTFADDIYALRHRVPSYAGWLAGQERRWVFEQHRLLLNCLLRRGEHDAVPVLKGPSHLWHLDALGAVYPDARVVRLHRPPATALASVCSLTRVVRGARSDQVDPEEIGAYWFDHLATALDATHPAGEDGVNGLAVLDVRYSDLIADPVAVVAGIAAFAGLDFGAPQTAAIRSRLAERPQHRHGVHTYTLEDFGLERPAVDARFARYTADFGL